MWNIYYTYTVELPLYELIERQKCSDKRIFTREQLAIGTFGFLWIIFIIYGFILLFILLLYLDCIYYFMDFYLLYTWTSEIKLTPLFLNLYTQITHYNEKTLAFVSRRQISRRQSLSTCWNMFAFPLNINMFPAFYTDDG